MRDLPVRLQRSRIASGGQVKTPGGSPPGVASYLDGGRILNIPVPQTGHTPFRAGRPFAIFTCCAFEILRFALHFTQ